MGVARGRGEHEVGEVSGWNLLYRYSHTLYDIDILKILLIPTPLVLALFCSSILASFFIF